MVRLGTVTSPENDLQAKDQPTGTTASIDHYNDPSAHHQGKGQPHWPYKQLINRLSL